MTRRPSLKRLAGIAIVLTATLSNAVAVEQPRTSILIPNIREPEEMRVAPFPMYNIVSTPADRTLGEAIEAGQAKMQSLSPYEAISDFTFFFSSRRRHTIFDCDWSSDVCSSD